jgi:hypothetical protein
MPNFSKFREKDIDGRWFEFDHQQMGNSCTLASAKIAKEFHSNQIISESALRGLATLFIFGSTNKGISSLEQIVTNSHNWETTPGWWEITLKVLKAQPLPIPNSIYASTDLAARLRNASRNHPVLIGWSWAGGAGGHCTVCVGPTKADPDMFVILDPGFGLQYISRNDMVGNSFSYSPIDKTTGAVAATGTHMPGSNTFLIT